MPVPRTDALRSAGGHRAGPSLSGRGLRLAVVVSVASAVVALGVTGAGLLLPEREPTSLTRVGAAVLAVAAAGALVRIDGPARGATTLVMVSVVALAVCLVTLPASPVTPPWESVPDAAGGSAPDGTEGRGRDVVIEPGDGGGAGNGGALALPPGADVVVDRGAVVLVLPDGGRITIGQAAIDGTSARIGPGGARVVVDGAVARRDDGGAIGADVALGGVTIERADGSDVAVGDDALIEVPEPLEADDQDESERLDAMLAVLLGCFALLAFAPPVVRFSDRSRVTLVEPAHAREPEIPRPPVTPTVEEGLADVLRSMLADPDPRTSVIGAYARLLTALAEAGFPRREEEGPHEHLWRSLGPLGVRRQPVHQLTELFVRARFTPRPVTEEHRQAAITALADAVADLRLQATDVREVAALVGVVPS